MFTLCFGWWGFISFLLTPFAVLHNVIRYVFCLRMPPVPRIKPRDSATTPATESPSRQKPVAKKMEVIWELPKVPGSQGEAREPIPDSRSEPDASAAPPV